MLDLTIIPRPDTRAGLLGVPVVSDPAVGMFADSKIQDVCDAVLASLPDGHNTAVLEIHGDRQDIALTAAIKTGTGWGVSGALMVDYRTHDFGFGVSVLKSW